MPNTAHNDIKTALGILTAVADAIRELSEVPSGHLYANLMGKLSLEQYQQIIGVLKSTGLVAESNDHLLTWLGSRATSLETAPLICVECDKPITRDDMGLCAECTEKSEHAEEGRR
jgi:hypothetical protein